MVPETVSELVAKLKQDWKFQNRGTYLAREPSHIYRLLYGSLPLSHKLKELLRKGDAEYFYHKRQHSSSTFKADIRTEKETLCWELNASPTNVISVVAARLAKRYNENVSLVRHKINNREYEVTITKLR